MSKFGIILSFIAALFAVGIETAQAASSTGQVLQYQSVEPGNGSPSWHDGSR